MKPAGSIALVILGSLFAALFGQGCLAKDAGVHLRAYSTTARGITGDITLSSEEIVFENGQRLELSYVGESSVGLTGDDKSPAKVFRIIRLRIVRTGGINALCGARTVPTYLAVSIVPRSPDLIATGVPKVLGLFAIKGTQAPGREVNPDRICASFSFAQS